MNRFQGTARYSYRQCLGSGSFGSVHEVFDQERQAPVALKIPHDPTAGSLFLFKKEFRALADISHPNLVHLHELVWDETQWFFTMELIEGVDILRFLRQRGSAADDGGAELPEPDPAQVCSDLEAGEPDAGAPTLPDERASDTWTDEDDLPPVSAPTNLQRVARAFRQLGEGLMAIHHAGLLHMDIKPSNVLVTTEGRVVLLDFGLSTEIEASARDSMPGSEITGTPAYMAPEQLLDNHCSEASDWYSVGVLLYHVLTGRLPFQGNGLRVLVNKVSQPPMAPCRMVPGIPQELSDLCMDLLSPHPELRPGGIPFLQRLECSETATDAMRRHGPRQEFIGRVEERDCLLLAFRSLQNGQAGWLNLHGGSGMGKSFLVRRFQQELAKLAPEALVLSGRCYEQEHVPYKAMDGLIDGLSHYLKRLPASRLDALLPRHTYALSQLFPVLRQVPRIAETHRRHAAIADPQELRHQAFAALRELLRRIGEAIPLVLIIDDLQWGDTDSAVLLTDLLSPPNAPHMLVVACYRTEESGTSPVLREFLSLGRSVAGRCMDVPIRELPPEQARDLARTVLEDDQAAAGELVDWVVRESGGNPFFIHELAQHLRSRRSPDHSCENLEAYIQARVTELPTEARKLLDLVALAGYPLDWHLLREAAGLGTRGIESLDDLKHGHLIRIRVIGKRRMVEPYHDFIRKAATAALPLEQAREGHLRLAMALEALPQPDVQGLAVHYKAAGETGKAIAYLTTAGLQASASLAFAKAASLLRMCLSLRDPDDPGSAAVWGHLGEALANAGRGKEAAEAYLRAADPASPKDANHFLRCAAQEYLKSGHLKEGTAVLERLLSGLGVRLASTPTQALLSALIHKAAIEVRGLRFKERSHSEVAPTLLDKLDTFWAATMGLATGDFMRVADFQARQLLLSLRTGEPVRLVRALAYEAIFSSSRGNRSEPQTRRYLDLAMRLAEKSGDPNAMSQALIASGIAHTAVGHWRKGAEVLDRVELQLRENSTGLSYELRNAQSYALINHYALGNLSTLAERLPLLFRDAEETGDLLFLANLKTGSAFIHYLARNEPELARTEIRQIMGRLPSDGFFHQRYLELAALGNIALYAGNPEEAWTFLSERWKELRRSRVMAVQAIRITCLELRGRLSLALAAGNADPHARKRLLKVARKDIQALLGEQIPYGTALALRLRTLEAAIEGRADDRDGFAFLAETAFDACDMGLHVHVMKRCRGLLKGEPGQSLVWEADEWMKRQGIMAPARMMAMFLPGMG